MPLEQILYPPPAPFAHGTLPVSAGHEIYYEQCGNPNGLAVVYLHGGPGGGCNAEQRRFFDPARYHCILFDQRGCGRSRPLGELQANDTHRLVADMEALRAHLGINRWLVFGGSWGASLALAYAAAHREVVTGLILRGVFLTDQRDLDWFFQGARQLLPEAWEMFATFVPECYRQDLFTHYAQVLESGARDQAAEAASRWAAYEQALITGKIPSPQPTCDAAQIDRLLAKYRVQSHYLKHNCFLGEHTLLEMASQLQSIPLAIIHGRLDFVCPPNNAWRLARAVAGSRLRIVEGAGHSPFDPALAKHLVSALNHYAGNGNFANWD